MVTEEQRVFHRSHAETNGDPRRWAPLDPELQEPRSGRGFVLGMTLGIVAWHVAGLFLWWVLSRGRP